MEVFKSNHLQAYEKEYWRLSGYKRIIRDNHQNCLFDKRQISYNKPSACTRKMGNVFVNRVMVKTDIPLAISKEIGWPKAGLKWTHFQRKGILTKNDLQLRLK